MDSEGRLERGLRGLGQFIGMQIQKGLMNMRIDGHGVGIGHR